MANPTSIVDEPVVFNVSSTEASLTLSKRRYQIYHNGLTNASTPVETSEVVYISFGTTAVDADGSEGANKTILTPTTPPIIVGPGLDQINFKTAANSATVSVVPVGF